jgi:Carboxypeptidase regulatory-like domain
MSQKQRTVFLLVLAAFAPIFVPPAAAQVATAELVGTVTDATGAGVPAATISAVNTATNITVRTVESGEDGSYIMTFLPPATYTVAIEKPGFRKLTQTGLTLEVNQRARLDFALQVGQVSEVVEVAATAPLLESQSSSLGNVIGQRFVSELPLNGRNFVQLAILNPGVNGTGFSVGGTIMSGTRPDDRRPGSEIFSNGNRENSNNFLYDGIDNNDRLTLSIVLRPAVEGVREFKVQTNMFSADLGRNSGAVVDVISKSGTNEFHGSVFEFHRNSYMDAKNFFAPATARVPPFRFNQFGGSLGGPLIRNKTFWFVDYEGYRRSLLSTINTTIPTMAMRTGNFSGQPNAIYDPLSTVTSGTTVTRTQFAGNQIPLTRFDPVTAKLINAYPTPQTAGLTNNYIAQLTLPQNWNQGDVRVDHQFTPNDSFFARWSIQNTSTSAPHTFPDVQIAGITGPVGVGNEDSFAGTAFNPTQHIVASYVKVISPRMVNDLRVGFNRFVLDYTAIGATEGGQLGNQLGVRNSNTHPQQSVLPIFSPAGYTGIGHSRSLPIFRRINAFQYGDNVTYTAGAHTLKFGGIAIRRQITEYQTNRGNGRYNFSPAFTDSRAGGASGHSMASFLTGYATLVEQDFTLAWTGQRGWETGLYIADDWRVTRNLTLNLGLRWEYYSPYVEVADRIANFDAATATVLVANRDGVSRTAGVNKDWRNYAPRFGFAYQLGRSTVVRGGYGLFFNPNGNGGALLRLFRHMPFGPIYSVSPGDVNVGPRVSDGFPAPPTVNFDSVRNPTGNVIGVSPDFRSAYAQQYNLSVQHEIAPWQLIVKAAFVGNVGRRLGTTFNLNQPEPGPGAVAARRPFFGVRPGVGDITYAVSDGTSNYNAFQLTVDKRLSSGLSMLLGYTWGHSIDTVANDFGGGTGTPQDRRCRSCDRGNAGFDIRHRATVSYTYELPFGQGRAFLNDGALSKYVFGGWQLNGITTLQSGLPFSPGLGNANTNGAGGSRPDVVGNPDVSEKSIGRWFDVAAFARPTDIRFGNLGRNTLFGPGRVNFDMSLFKKIPVTERVQLELRGEAFNIWNTPQFGQPNATITVGANQIGTTAGNSAGTITSIVGNPRQLQVGARIVF